MVKDQLSMVNGESRRAGRQRELATPRPWIDKDVIKLSVYRKWIEMKTETEQANSYT
jgi:hypothetical protein